ncbi:MAG: hypothetical protein ACI9VR_001765 [Cognaticolwellia sp.]|jgi:hypothetical protein
MSEAPVKKAEARSWQDTLKVVSTWIQEHPVAVFLALVVVAVLLRFPGAEGGLPYCWHPDEPKLINKGIEMLQSGDLNPHWFHYPSLPIYIQAVGAALGYLDLVGNADFIPLADIPTGASDNLVHTIGDAHMWARGRKITGLMGALAAGFTMLTGRKLFGPWVGLAAGLMVAFSPLHLVHSALITVDVPTSLGVSVLMLASAWVYTRGSAKDYLLASVCLGLAIGFKYNAAVGALTPLAAWLLSERRQERLGLGLLLVPLGMVVFVLTMPFALVEPSVALTDMAKEVNHYMVMGHGAASIEPGPTHLLAMLSSLVVDYLPVWTLGLLGLPLAMKGGKWKALLIVAAFPLAYIAYMSGSTVFFKRNIVVLVPGFALLSAVGIRALVEAFVQRTGRSELGMGLGVALVMLPTLFGVVYVVSNQQNITDSRTEMTTWLHAPEQVGWVIAVPEELRIAEEELHGLQWVPVKFNDGPEGWAKAGASHVLGGTRLKVSGTRNTPIKGKATDGAVDWYKAQPALQTFGYTGWMLDMNAQDPEISVYAIDGAGKSAVTEGHPEGQNPVEKAPIKGNLSIDDAERWQVTPKGHQSKVILADGELKMLAEPSVRSVKACEVERIQVQGQVNIVGRWQFSGVSREDMAGQLQARFFQSDGGFIDGGMAVLGQAAGDSDGWLDVDETVQVPEGAAKVRLCVELGSDQGTLRVSKLKVVP